VIDLAFPRLSLLRGVAGVVALLTLGLPAADYQPSELDPETLHLWHLDESSPPFADAVEGGLPLSGLLNGGRANQPALPGLGRSISFHAAAGGRPGQSDLKGAILIPGPVTALGTEDNAPPDFRYFGPDGAFTFEMVVKLDVLPRDAPSIALDLLTMEGDGADRIFNFRIEKDGFLAFVPLPHCGASGGGIATLPTSGNHAIDTQSWFHVAVTYNGKDGVSNNLKLFWTRLQPGLVAANPIGSGTLSTDLNGNTGDFAIGNEAREFPQNAEAEPFPGSIDEVRISGVARHPSDFFFVPPELRLNPKEVARHALQVLPPPVPQLDLIDVQVNSQSAKISNGQTLNLGSGLHRLDFDFGFRVESSGEHENLPSLDPPDDSGWGDVRLFCQLEGIDDQWQETEVGMALVCQTLDAYDRVLSQTRFPAVGRSEGWKTTLEDSTMTRRIEPIYIPETAATLKLILNSGSPDTTGFYTIDFFSLQDAGETSPSLMKYGVFNYDAYTTSPAGSPPGWKRGGTDASIARMILRPEHPGVGLVDGDQAKYGEWSSLQPLPVSLKRGSTCSLSWYEAYNVIGGSTHRATYVNVPPGEYLFRAIGLEGSRDGGHQVALAIKIQPPIWQHVWFWPLVAAVGVGLTAAAIMVIHRQRSKRAMEILRYQNALERDRSRIARDMHDDLGTRVTFITMSAALATRDMERAPENARRHLNRVTESARELVMSMDDLVWAVDPAHDTLDHLGSHFLRLAAEMFRDSPVRCRPNIPALLPAVPLGADTRHHIALAVKESFHNILRHAGPCEVYFALEFDGREIHVTIRDTGRGFDPENHERGHGLDNLSHRFKEIGGTCEISSSPGGGTCIVLSCNIQEIHCRP
jgi:signal transduction histidine kinase